MADGASDVARLNALGFVEQTIYANEDSPNTVTWDNAEVLEMLRDIRDTLRLYPDTPDHENSAPDRESEGA